MPAAPRASSLWPSALAAALILGLLVPVLLAAPSREQASQARAVAAQLKKAGNLYRARKIKESAAAVREAQTGLERLVADGSADAVTLAKPLRQNLEKAVQLLVLEGEKFEPLPELPTGGKPAGKPGAPAADAAAGGAGISFVTQVAPLLVAKCGRCHADDAKGGFSLATFSALQKGSRDGGIVLQPGSGAGSRLVEVIESGDMPRGGLKVTPAELALLTKWIDEGAKFDGGRCRSG